MLGALKLPRLLPSFRTLDIYILRRFLGIYVANLISFTLIFVCVDLLSHIDDFSKRTEGFQEMLSVCATYYSAITPLIFCQILGPVVSVSAALFAVTTLQKSNELTPILATGQSYQRTFLPVITASLFVSAGVFFIQELWIPRTVSAVRETAASRGGSGVTKHVTHLDNAYQNLIAIKEYNRRERTARGIDVLPIGPRDVNQRVIRAASARWVPDVDGAGAIARGHWLLENGTVQEYDPGGRRLVLQRPDGPEGLRRLDRPFQELRLETDLIPADIELRKDENVYMTLADLRNKAEKSLDQSGWYMKYFSRFAYPLTNFILVLIGLPVIVYFGNRNIFFGAILAVVISTCYFVVNSIFQDLGIQGVIPVRLGAGLAPVFFTALGLTLYREMQT